MRDFAIFAALCAWLSVALSPPAGRSGSEYCGVLLNAKTGQGERRCWSRAWSREPWVYKLRMP
jgi:hypothetical protein